MKILTTLLLIPSLALSQSFYQCKDSEGKLAFQQIPCTGEGKEITVKPLSNGNGGSLMNAESRSYLKTLEEGRAKQDQENKEYNERLEANNIERSKVHAANRAASAQEATAAAIRAAPPPRVTIRSSYGNGRRR